MKNEIAYDKQNAFVVDTTAVQVRIKKILVDDLISGKPKDVTDKKVAKVVDEFVRHIKSPSIRQRYLRTIADNYRKWYTAFAVSVVAVKSFEKANQALIKAANTEGFGGVVFNFNTRNFRTSEERATVVIEDYKNKVKKAYASIVKELSKDELKELSGGTLRNYAEIRVRWEANRDDIERLKAEGVTHVWASSHANCSERCSHWQGKLYSLYEESGVLDGISFQPLSEAMRGKKNDDNGLLGYNCRHRIIPYFKGSTAPKEYTKEQIEKASEIDKQQRYMERKIRKKKEDAFLLKGVDNKLSKELFGQARELTDEYRKYSEEHKRPAYIYRTQIMREELSHVTELSRRNIDTINKYVYNKPIPNAINAVTAEEKVKGYLLNPEHKEGKHKAVVFNSIGYNQDNWEEMSDQMYRKLQTSVYTETRNTKFGKRFTVPMEITGPNGKTANVDTVWQFDKGKNAARLITVHFPKRRKND